MPLQNRVDPWGELFADDSRGTFMGNRGGAMHNDDKQIVRVQTSPRWIICRTDFKGRRRPVMAPGQYTELFFLDEATALAAGHRPCFECRRPDAADFLSRWKGLAKRPDAKVGELDAVLAEERRVPRAPLGTGKRAYRGRLDKLPDRDDGRARRSCLAGPGRPPAALDLHRLDDHPGPGRDPGRVGAHAPHHRGRARRRLPDHPPCHRRRHPRHDHPRRHQPPEHLMACLPD